MKKYYWYLWSYINASGNRTFEMKVTCIHPFAEIATRRDNAPPGTNVVLMDWKEITEEEYTLFLRL